MAYNNLLKELDVGLKSVKYNLENEESATIFIDDKKRELLRLQLEYLSEIDDYIRKYKWIHKKSMTERIEYLRECDFDKLKMQEKYGMSESALKSFMFRLSSALKETIGENTIRYIMSYDIRKIEEGILQFRINIGICTLEDLLLGGIVDYLPEKKLGPYALNECKRELQFIYMFSKKSVEETVKKINLEKLAFVCHILEEDTYFNDDKQDLIAGLTFENKDFKEVVNNIVDRGGYNG